MNLSKMENNKRVWVLDVDSLKDRTLVSKELIRVGFKKWKNNYLIEGSHSKDTPGKKQGVFVFEYTNSTNFNAEYGVFFVRWGKDKELDQIYHTLKELKPPTVPTSVLWEVVYNLWVESINKVGDFSFLYNGRVTIKENREQKYGRINFVVE